MTLAIPPRQIINCETNNTDQPGLAKNTQVAKTD
jgi:hypothetical protein